MPVPRKKSCQQCRHAKARCSLDPICSRCTERGFPCDYAGTSSSHSTPYPPPVSTPPVPPNQLQPMADMAHIAAHTTLGLNRSALKAQAYSDSVNVHMANTSVGGSAAVSSGFNLRSRRAGNSGSAGKGQVEGEGKNDADMNMHDHIEQERQRTTGIPHHMLPTPGTPWISSGWNEFPDHPDWQQQQQQRQHHQHQQHQQPDIGLIKEHPKSDEWDEWAPNSIPWFSQPRLFNTFHEPASSEHPPWTQLQQSNTNDFVDPSLHHMMAPRGESPQSSLSAASTTTATTATTAETPSLIGSPNTTNYPLYSHRSKPILSLRPVASIEDRLNTQVVIGQISQYPRMLIGKAGNNGKLPPFIHPRCVLFDTQPAACISDGVHRCLLGPLANCARLLKLYYGQNIGNSELIWGAIYTETKRLRDEYTTFDAETLLAANQALCLYLLLQIGDPKSVENNDVVYLTQVTAEVNLKLYSTLPLMDDIFIMENFSRRLWVLYESMRRTVCLLLVVELIWVAFYDEVSSTQFGGIISCPLPCARDLWDSDEAEPWAVRLMRFMREREVIISGSQRFQDENYGHTSSGSAASQSTAAKELPVITVGDLRFVCGFNPSDYVPASRRRQQHAAVIGEFLKVIQKQSQEQQYKHQMRSNSPSEQPMQIDLPVELNTARSSGDINHTAADIDPTTGADREAINKQIITQQVSRWCETLDEYGMLVWMTTSSMDPKRTAMRTPMATPGLTT